MRQTKLQTIYLTEEELKAAVKLYLSHIGKHELVKRLDGHIDMGWSAAELGSPHEFCVSIDGEILEE